MDGHIGRRRLCAAQAEQDGRQAPSKQPPQIYAAAHTESSLIVGQEWFPARPQVND